MGPTDLKMEIFNNAQTIIVDNWYQVTGFKLSPLWELREKGVLKKEDTTELRYIVDGQKPGRQSEDDLVVYASLGLGSMDIAIGYKLYQSALAQGIGVELPVWNAPKWL
jgi:ornithine cyclodeaminase